MASAAQQFCTFFVNGQFFGVPVQQVQEVIRGLVNLRGQIIVAIDLRHRLGASGSSENQHPMNVVVRTVDGAVSLLVDEIGDVLEVTDDALESPPETLSAATRSLVLGVYKLPKRLLLVLDTDRAVTVGAMESRLPAAEAPL